MNEELVVEKLYHTLTTVVISRSVSHTPLSAGVEEEKRGVEPSRLPGVVGEREAQGAPERPADHRTLSVVRIAAVPRSRHDGIDCAIAGKWRASRVLRQAYVSELGTPVKTRIR